MFENLSDRLSATFKQLTGTGRLTEQNIQEGLKEVRLALLEADVALPVVTDFMKEVKEQAIGQAILKDLNPGQALVKIVHGALTQLMGQTNETLNLQTQPPAVILVAGLQGSGKTTTVAKLARWLKERGKKSVLITSADIYRPAAIQQLETLAEEVGVSFHPSHSGQQPQEIAEGAITAAKKQFIDVVIVDTAGRLHVDDAMMAEVKALHQAIDPIETLFVVDSMTGQDAANSAKAFDDALPLTGVILTKIDGDARGGAALSIRHITQKPIKFFGMGEKTDALEPFHPDRIASRILGMGDVLTLIEEVEHKVDKKKADKLAKKVLKGRGFDLNDFLDQLQQMRNMGGMASMLEKMPGMNKVPEAVKQQMDGRQSIRMEAIIQSMTPQEKRFPAILKASRKKRIAAGSGTQVQDINRLIKQFTQAQKMMKRMGGKGGGMKKMMRQMQQLKDHGGF